MWACIGNDAGLVVVLLEFFPVSQHFLQDEPSRRPSAMDVVRRLSSIAPSWAARLAHVPAGDAPAAGGMGFLAPSLG